MSYTRPELLAIVRTLAAGERSAKRQLDHALAEAYAAGISARRLGIAIGRSHQNVRDRIHRHEQHNHERITA